MMICILKEYKPIIRICLLLYVLTTPFIMVQVFAYLKKSIQVLAISRNVQYICKMFPAKTEYVYQKI